MMKVKPFSYHIPPRRKAFSIWNTTSNLLSSSSTSITSCCNKNNGSGGVIHSKIKNCTSTTNSLTSTSNFMENVCSLCGVGGTVLILLFLGFIEVAGQGKLHEIEDEGGSPFATQSQLSSNYYNFPHTKFFQLPIIPNLDTLEDDGIEDDESLQQRISLMGRYGAKYQNNTQFYNYSSEPLYLYHSQQYKVGLPLRTGGYPPTSSYDSLSLSLGKEEDKVDDERENLPTIAPISTSGEIKESKRPIEENWNEVKSDNNASKARKSSGNSVNNKFSSMHLPNYSRLSNPSRKNRFFNVTHHPTFVKARMKSIFNDSSHFQGGVSQDELISFAEEKRKSEKLGDTNDSEDYEEYALEKFIPANRSHTSGKLKFRQSSQAELDGLVVDLTENSSIPTSSESSSRRRPRRSVVHLYDMVVCSTGCNPLIFKGYGCYCGFLGSGLTVDGIDKCCAKHDWCYHHAKCPPLLTYFVPYYWTCNHGRPQCVTDFRGWKGICGAHLCECDRQFAECLKKFPCPRTRAMCVTSPFSNSQTSWHADSRAFPFTVSSRRPRFPQWQPPPIPPPPRTPILPFPPHSHKPIGRIF